MKRTNRLLLACVACFTLALPGARAATLLMSDNFDVVNTGTGFALNTGVNTGINPPTSTRLVGSVVAAARYNKVEGTRGAANHYITNAVPATAPGKMFVGFGTTQSRITFTNIGTLTDFGPALFTSAATPDVPTVYELQFKMAHFGTNRVGFGISTADGGAGVWDFGFELMRNLETEPMSLMKRVDTASGGLGVDLNGTITNNIGAAGEELNFKLRITDAGAESSTFSSRVELAIIRGGATNWIYDTLADTTDLPFGWRFDGVTRYLIWNFAGGAGPGTVDDLTLTWISGPTRGPLTQTWTGGGPDSNWSSAGNWGGVALASGDSAVFGATVKQNNNNDLTSLLLQSINFNAGGFSLSGNETKVFAAITNIGGNNTIALPLTWSTAGAKRWHLSAGNTLTVSSTTSVDVNGDHTLLGGGTIRIAGIYQVGTLSSANPATLLADGRIFVDGGQLTTRGGLRIGANGATTPTLSEMVLSNNASVYQTVSGASTRVGSINNGLTNRLVMDHSTFTQSGGEIGVPWNAGAIAEVTQVGGSVVDGYITFNHDGAGTGRYTVLNGTLELRGIRKAFPGGLTTLTLDNTILRTSLSAESGFMAALDVAEIRSGGLTLDVTALDVVLASSFSGAGGLTKSGPYSATFTGTNSYAGNTIVQAGQLVLPTTQTNNASIQVADGAAFGVKVIAPDSTMTASSLSIAGATSTLAIDLGTFSNPTVPIARVGTLTSSATITVNISGGSPAMATGTISLLKWSILSGSPSFVLGTLPSNLAGNLVVNSGSLDLVITGVQGYRWTGAFDGNWDTFTQNWLYLLNNTASTYADGYGTEFRDGANTGLVTLNGTFSPTLLTVSNTTLAYTLTGGGINTPVLRKIGSGTVTRTDGTSDAIGQIELNEGSFAANATVDQTFGSTLADTSAGLGTFVKQGPAVLTVTSTNTTYDGSVLIQAGTLKLGTNSAALGSTNGSTTVANGASLDVANVQAVGEPVFASGDGVNGQGAIVNTLAGGGVQNNLTDVTLNGDTTFGCAASGRWDIRVRTATGPGPGLRGNGHNISKVGAGTLSISSQRTLGAATPYWHMNLGNVLIKEGTLAFEESIDLGDPGKSITLYAGTTMNLFDLNVTNPIQRTIIGTNCSLTCGGKTTDTNILNGPIQLDGAVSIRPNVARYFFNGIISGNASISIGANPGAGIVTLNGSNTFTGDLTVTNSTLAGNGSIAANLIMAGGSLAPGDGVGAFRVGGNATLSGTTTLELAPGQPTNCDRLVVNGTITAGGTLVVAFVTNSVAPSVGEVFQLFNQGVTGFASISLPSLASYPGLAWDANALSSNGSIKIVSSTPPSIGNVSLSGSTFTFSGTGGTAGATYYVVSSTNVAAPMTNWLPVASNVFGPGGTFSFSTNVTSSARSFFRLALP